MPHSRTLYKEKPGKTRQLKGVWKPSGWFYSAAIEITFLELTANGASTH